MDLSRLIDAEAMRRGILDMDNAYAKSVSGVAGAQGLKGSGMYAAKPAVPGNLQIMGLMHLLNDATGGRPLADGTLDAHRHVLGVPASIEPDIVGPTVLDDQFMDLMRSGAI